MATRVVPFRPEALVRRGPDKFTVERNVESEMENIPALRILMST